MRKKNVAQRSAKLARETAGAARGAATRAEHVARRLLRRTGMPTHDASPTLPETPVSPAATEAQVVAVLPVAPAREQEDARELAMLRARAERAEHAAAWLRARLRAERAREKHVPHLDVAALAADLARDLAGLRSLHSEAVRRVVQRALAAHGLPVSPPGDKRAGEGGPAADLPGLGRERQELLAQQVLARAPDVAGPTYVYRVLALVAQHGRLTLPELTRAAGLESAMARRRLRLAVEALTALGVLVPRDGAYSLNPDWQESHQQRVRSLGHG